jgi:hypothetical protein
MLLCCMRWRMAMAHVALHGWGTGQNRHSPDVVHHVPHPIRAAPTHAGKRAPLTLLGIKLPNSVHNPNGKHTPKSSVSQCCAQPQSPPITNGQFNCRRITASAPLCTWSETKAHIGERRLDQPTAAGCLAGAWQTSLSHRLNASIPVQSTIVYRSLHSTARIVCLQLLPLHRHLAAFSNCLQMPHLYLTAGAVLLTNMQGN